MVVAVPGHDFDDACGSARQEGPSGWRNQPARCDFSQKGIVYMGVMESDKKKKRKGMKQRGNMG